MPPKPRRFKPKVQQAKEAVADQEKKAEEKIKADQKKEEKRIKNEEFQNRKKGFGDKKGNKNNRRQTLQERSVFDTEVPTAVRRGAVTERSEIKRTPKRICCDSNMLSRNVMK